MNAKEMLDMCDKIIKRQDLDRNLLLFFINTLRRGFMRDKNLRKFHSYIENAPMINGIIDLDSINVKFVRSVEWIVDDANGDNVKIRLSKLGTYEDAIDIYHNLTKVGTPKHYVEVGNKLLILPVPIEGSINLFAEVLPIDLTDSADSKDTLTEELGEAWVYLGSAEYYDMLGESSQGNIWRAKGNEIINSFVRQSKLQDTDDIELLHRDPFGNLPSKFPTKVVYDTVVVDDLDGGEW